jgi:hypothetical protein
VCVCVCVYIYIRCGHCVNVATFFIAKRIGSLNECCLLLFNWFWLLQYSYVGQVSVYMSNWVEVLTHTSCWLCLVVLLPEVDVWEANWVWKFCALKYSTVLFFLFALQIYNLQCWFYELKSSTSFVWSHLHCTWMLDFDTSSELMDVSGSDFIFWK